MPIEDQTPLSVGGWVGVGLVRESMYVCECVCVSVKEETPALAKEEEDIDVGADAPENGNSADPDRVLRCVGGWVGLGVGVGVWVGLCVCVCVCVCPSLEKDCVEWTIARE